jgi:hypothetical protein
VSSALARVGLSVSDEAELGWLVTSAHRAVRETGVFDGVHAGRWQDDSGASLILGWRSGELLDFIPAYTATSGGRLADCHLINESVAAAAVVGADGQQVTAMAFEAEQYRQLRALGRRVSGRGWHARERRRPRWRRFLAHLPGPGMHPPCITVAVFRYVVTLPLCVVSGAPWCAAPCRLRQAPGDLRKANLGPLVLLRS